MRMEETSQGTPSLSAAQRLQRSELETVGVTWRMAPFNHEPQGKCCPCSALAGPRTGAGCGLGSGQCGLPDLHQWRVCHVQGLTQTL